MCNALFSFVVLYAAATQTFPNLGSIKYLLLSYLYELVSGDKQHIKMAVIKITVVMRSVLQYAPKAPKTDKLP